MDELDFWAGTFLLIVFATVEVILFVWVYGIDNAWEELHQGAKLRLPRFFKYIFKYVTPLYLLVLFGAWIWQEFWPMITMERIADADKPYIWGARLLILGLFTVCGFMVKRVAHRFAASREPLPEGLDLEEAQI